MKRLIYSAAVLASLTLTSTNMAVAGKHDHDKVLMCEHPGRRDQKDKLVDVTDIAKKLAEGDLLGSCFAPPSDEPLPQ